MDGDDRDYYRARAADERRQAERARDPAVRRIHLSIADEYARRSGGIAEALARGHVSA